ncbi:MAG TPA: 1-acyl-sn-glycerol-3-phosphate acyltransferase [Flavipsychrobacter sp.]|nr:1-acyl-sn-glycerol-3-phosphate acyltransferase [Flavipsychrobacter sp.]
MLDLFASVYDLLHKRRRLFWALFVLSFTLWILLAFQIRLKQDINAMLPNSKAIKAMSDVVGKTKASEQLIFLVSGDKNAAADPDSLIAAANSFQEVLEKQKKYIDTVTMQPAGGGNEEAVLELFRDYLPLFLEKNDYAKLASLTTDSAIAGTLKENRKVLLSPAGVVMKRFVAQDPIGISSLALKKLSLLQVDTSYEAYDGYLFSKDEKQLSFFVKPKFDATETGKNTVFFKSLDADIEKWVQHHEGISVQYFGGAAVAAGNASQLQTDTIVTLSVTVVLLLALTFYFFKRKRTPLLLFIPVVYGAAVGLGVLYLVQGSVSVIALGAGALVLGIAIDFSIHFLAHARHAKDMRTTVSEMSHPLTVGSFTTIAAFLSLRFVDTPILQDLGLFAGASLAGAAFCTLIFLPHFPLGIDINKHQSVTLFDRLGGWQPEKNKWLVLGIVLLTPVFFHFAKKVEFDSDLMHLNYLSPQLQQAQDEVSRTNAMALSAVYLMAKGNNDQEALEHLESATQKVDRLKAGNIVRSASNPAALLPSRVEQEKRITAWNAFWTPQKKTQVLAAVKKYAPEAGFNPEAFAGFDEMIQQHFTIFNADAVGVLKSFFPSGFARNEDQYYAIASLRVANESRSKVFDAFKEDRDVVVTDRQQGATQLVGILKSDFNTIALYSSLIVFFALLIGYGRIELAIISFLPMIISWIWILGIMALLGLKFNIVNIIISSLIFGLGDDFAIFTMDGLVEKYKNGSNKLKSARAAVYVSVVTVIIGLGVLLLAKHPALRSIAFISVTGLLCVLFISQTLQPFLFNWFIQNRADKKFLPFTLWSFTKSVFAFAYFFTGSLVLTIAGFFLTKLRPFGKERSKYIFHKFLSGYTWSLMHIMRNIRVREFNRSQNNFDEPAVYIANHASFLDILSTTMLHPKLILLTNKWTWRSPVFGAVVRMAEYYPVADGAEDSIEPLRDLVSRGYSIMVFPEGRRSVDDSIKRFHKGAFYISEQLKLDIIPLVLHGIQYTMQKGDWLLKNGTCNIYYYPKIAYDDAGFGKNYSEKTKRINKWFREEYRNIKEQNETPSYFREQLLRSYTYKGPGLEWYCRIKTRLEDNYEAFHKLLPRKGIFYDLGCGYGFLSYMLHWAAPERIFTGVDYDEDKIEVAQNNMFKDETIRFEHADLTRFDLEPCDGIIINDVLHYLLPQQQQELLEKCHEALHQGGTLIIRDGVSELQDRIKGTKQTELWSTKLMKFNKTENELHYIQKSFVEDFALKHRMALEEMDMSKFTANVTFVLKKKSF